MSDVSFVKKINKIAFYICMKRLYFTITFCFFLFLLSICRDIHTDRQTDRHT